MTTETPSVDEARRAYESAVEHALDNMDKEDGRHDEAECRAFRDAAFARLAAVVRAEAIRERDEAVGLLRDVEWKAAVELIIGGWGLGCPSCGSPADDLDMSEHYPDCPLDAFLSRFPEATEGGEG
ncbi:MAG: hypothetical protein M0R75_13650 [Dehalococcoidia bacterium]|nr:hypothetical protein [Dehalococcoidia bacterium]